MYAYIETDVYTYIFIIFFWAAVLLSYPLPVMLIIHIYILMYSEFNTHMVHGMFIVITIRF
jgi:hypothetical protein